MNQRQLGKNGPKVSCLGLGCMGMSEFYGRADENESKATILTALENGITMLDTADCYNNGHNEELIGSVLNQWHGSEVLVATKFGIVREEGKYERSICGRPEYVKKSAEASLRRLGRDVIDLYYIHRIDATVPIEDTIGAMSEIVRQGKVRFIGISEASAATIWRAHAIHPLSAVQSEYSLFTRQIEKEILPLLHELGISLVAYSPLGRGFLTGKLDQATISADGDFRKTLPRMQGENFIHNRALVAEFGEIAKSKGVKASQLALAWVLTKGENIIPIPGTKRRSYLLENIEAAKIAITEKERIEIETLFNSEAIQGERYTLEGMKGINK
jgi:aryl-alcohol dehydrogenase-like predicted oxidoreductase